jgi:hypothetical protein
MDMKEGYYWIQHNGVVQVAFYSEGVTEDLETGNVIQGYGISPLAMIFVTMVKPRY